MKRFGRKLRQDNIMILSIKVMPRYEYRYKKVPLGEDQITTDGEGRANYNFPVDKDKSYLVEFSTLDFGKYCFGPTKASRLRVLLRI